MIAGYTLVQGTRTKSTKVHGNKAIAQSLNVAVQGVSILQRQLKLFAKNFQAGHVAMVTDPN